MSRFGDDCPEHRVASAKTLGTVLHLHRGTPYVYQGEELGMTNAPFESIADYRDIESIRYHEQALEAGVPLETVMAALALKGRDNARTPMQWDAGPHAGFTTGEPWLPVNPNHVEINAAAAQADPASVFNHYRALIALRHEHPLVVDGRFELLVPDHPHLWVIVREGAAGRLVVLANCSSLPVTADAGDPPGPRRRHRAAHHPPRPQRARPVAVGVQGLRGGLTCRPGNGPMPGWLLREPPENAQRTPRRRRTGVYRRRWPTGQHPTKARPP